MHIDHIQEKKNAMTSSHQTIGRFWLAKEQSFFFFLSLQLFSMQSSATLQRN